MASPPLAPPALASSSLVIRLFSLEKPSQKKSPPQAGFFSS
jgi:hypothetical protein